MPTTAKLFQNGKSQAVRLPKKFRFEKQKEVFIKKLNNTVVLIPKNDSTIWDMMFQELEHISDDFMEERA